VLSGKIEERSVSISRANRALLSSISAILVLITAPAIRASAQAAPQAGALRAGVQGAPQAELDELAILSAAVTANDSGPAGIVPLTRGFNASLGTTSQHDSINGWSSLLTPNVAYRLNRHFSFSAGTPIYIYLDDYENTGTTAKPFYRYVPRNGVFGDTALSFEGDARMRSIGYMGTLFLGFPTGDTAYGLGAGQTTFSFNNHFEKSFFRFTPNIELGAGDTSGLVDRRILKNYIAVGPMAHFQAGMCVDLPWTMSFEADMYEELPMAKNLVYSTTGKGKKKVTTVTNYDPGEDNGFLSSLDIPLSPHVTLSGFYNRSLRDHEDVGGFSLTFLLKGLRPVETEH